MPQVYRVINKALKADRGIRYKTCAEFRQAIEKITFAIDWVPKNNSAIHWIGTTRSGDNCEIRLYSQKKGFCIDFTRNGRKLGHYSYVNISDGKAAKDEFFKTIRQTTIKFNPAPPKVTSRNITPP